MNKNTFHSEYYDLFYLNFILLTFSKTDENRNDSNQFLARNQKLNWKKKNNMFSFPIS